MGKTQTSTYGTYICGVCGHRMAIAPLIAKYVTVIHYHDTGGHAYRYRPR